MAVICTIYLAMPHRKEDHKRIITNTISVKFTAMLEHTIYLANKVGRKYPNIYYITVNRKDEL